MIYQLELAVRPERIADEPHLRQAAAAKLGLGAGEITALRLRRRSLDARGRRPVYRLQLEVYVAEPPPAPAPARTWPVVHSSPEALVVGSGPAGLFAALRLIERGVRPVILERGKDVRARLRDLRAVQQRGQVNPDSNYCFGEGGAGTYSDGKLYTRATKRGDVEGVLSLLCEHGASPDILVEAHPHVGSNKLPGIVQALRERVLACGGELRFGARVTDLLLGEGKVRGVVVNDAEELLAEAVILGTGHSARDVFALLHRRGLALEPKPFAMGLRIEHPQALVDAAQYGRSRRGPQLPPASYALTCQVEGRGVFTFCMCPGGMIVPASTAPDELVLNGMSLSRRDSPLANAGLVVSVEPEDWAPFARHGVFAGLELQRSLERAAFTAGGGAQRAPAQRAQDFLHGALSAELQPSSYQPGLTAAPLHELLPAALVRRLQAGLRHFGHQLRGFAGDQAQLLAVESRTSSPVRILRDPERLMHPQAQGLFPAGEGAGYAGGIVSSALDGQRCAEAAACYLGR